MPSQLNEKRHAIVALLDCLRLFNPQIGSYEKSIYTDDFDYSVKLSNGRIRIPEEVIQDFEKSPLTVQDEVYKMLSKRFVPNQATPEPISAPLSNNTASMQKGAERKPISNIWKVAAIVMICFVLGFYRYSNAQKEKEIIAKQELEARLRQETTTRDSAQKESERIEKDRKLETARIKIYDQVLVENNAYHVDQLFGGITGLQITVINNSDYTLDMVKIKVSYIKASGGLYKDEYVYFNKIAPHSTLTQSAPDSNRGTSLTIERMSLTCAELNLY